VADLPETNALESSERPRPPADAQPIRLGDFELISELGKGGMGVVYRARQVSLQREVALKVLPKMSMLDKTSVQRFRREAAAAAKLRHPGIVPVHAVGVEDGVYFYAMELLDGPNLASILEELAHRRPERFTHPLPVEAGIQDRLAHLAEHPRATWNLNPYLESCVGVALHLCDALRYAHAHGLIHRDLKPGNILFDASGHPVLVDFGLVRTVGVRDLTLTMDQLGTPSYMAPEQATGAQDIDERADVYGFGAVLYEMLTLRPPFLGLSSSEILQKLATEDIEPVRQHNASVPQDLEAIVHRCLAKDRGERYPAVEAVELDLRAFLAGRSVGAKRLGLVHGLRRTVRRNRTVGRTVAATALVAAALAGVTGTWMQQSSRTEGQHLIAEATEALVERLDVSNAQRAFGEARARLGDDAVRQARVTAYREAFDRHYPERLADLNTAFASLDGPERARLDDLLLRLNGRGTLRREGSTPIAFAKPDASAPGAALDWRSFETNSVAGLPIGDVLLRIGDEGDATPPVLLGTTIERDRETLVHVDRIASLRPHEDMILHVQPSTGAGDAIARTELSVAAYREWLAGLQTELRDEMQPDRFGADERDRAPVRGLSFRQARAFAATHDAHLMTLDEFRRAASSGLRSHVYPWGDSFDPERIAADPRRLERPVEVDAVRRSASPAGVLHMLGNVAEILSASPDGVLAAAGGHFHSEDAAGLRLDAAERLVERLADRDARSPYLGMRLARFVAPRLTTGETEAFERARGAAREQREPSLLHDWHLRRDGKVDYALDLIGFRPRTNEPMAVGVVVPGFLIDAPIVVRDSYGDEIARLEAPPGREALSMRVPDGVAAPGQRYMLRVETTLVPTASLVGAFDGYRMTIPIKVGPHRTVVHRVTLPGPAGLDRLVPAPGSTYVGHDETGVVWEFPPTAVEAVLPSEIVFRIDGMVSTAWPALRPIRAFVQELAAAFDAGDEGTLRELVDERFLQVPGYLDRGAAIRPGWQSLANARILDATPVGDVVTVDLVADWTVLGRDGEPVRIDGLPMQMQLVRDGDALRLLRLSQRTRIDSGTFDGRVYRNDELGVEIAPPENVAIHRLQTLSTPMQVRLVDPADPRVRVEIAGLDAAPDETEARNAMLLSGADLELRPGQRLSPDRADVPQRDSEWLFADAGGQVSRESFRILHRGRRRFLARFVTLGGNEASATARHAAATEWFEACLTAMRIE
jgi:serine/threonine protein kinase